MNDYINYYDLLGIKKDASIDEIKSAYRNQAKKWHPDLNKDPSAPDMAKKINEAKEILLDENKRKEYDEYLENYKSGAYDKINKTNTSYNTNNNYEEKTYTKWEYLMLYLKYYNIPIYKKIFATIFVLIESLLCSILQLINLGLAYFFAYFGYYIAYGIMILCGIGLIYIIANGVLNLGSFPSNTFEYVTFIFVLVIGFIISTLIKDIPNFLVNTSSVAISKLNMFLFKLSVGYKDK